MVSVAWTERTKSARRNNSAERVCILSVDAWTRGEGEHHRTITTRILLDAYYELPKEVRTGDRDWGLGRRGETGKGTSTRTRRGGLAEFWWRRTGYKIRLIIVIITDDALKASHKFTGAKPRRVR